MSIKGRIGLVQAERKWLNEMAAKYRYMHKAPSARSCTFGWAVTWDGKPINDQGDPYGFVIYALIHYTKLQGEFGYPGLPTNWQVLNLARLWLHDDLPRNSETWVIGNTLKLVQRRWLEVHPPPPLPGTAVPHCQGHLLLRPRLSHRHHLPRRQFQGSQTRAKAHRQKRQTQYENQQLRPDLFCLRSQRTKVELRTTRRNR